MTPGRRPSVRVHAPLAYYWRAQSPQPAREASGASRGPALRRGEELIYKTRAARGSV